MTAYIVIFALPAWFALCNPTIYRATPQTKNFHWQVTGIILSLAIGLRHEVGGDWYTYIEGGEYVRSLNLSSALTQLGSSDPAFALLTWLTPAEGGDYLVNLVCGIIFTVGLLSFCHAQPNPWLALTVAVPYLITIVAMGYTRQGVAIGLSMLGLVALNQQKTLRFFLWICIASAFHKSAVILIPLAFFSGGGLRPLL
jgi:hypothetical protein